jgi:hypothetical protein
MDENKKYFIRLYSGTGNELFIYSFYKYLQKKFNLNIFLDVDSGILQNFGTNPEGTKLTLNKFNIDYNVAENEYCYPGFFGKIRRFIDKSIINKKNYFTEKNFNINVKKIVKSRYKLNYIEGYFQDIKFTNYSKETLRKEIIPKKKNKYFYNLKKKINFKNSLCLGYRDFGHNDKLIFKKIDVMLDHPSLKNKKIYIFTNNMKKLNENSKNLQKKKFEEVKFNFKKHSTQALDLMTNFNTFIIGSSTFHWWGSYLSKNAKVVYLTNNIHKSLKTLKMKLI